MKPKHDSIASLDGLAGELSAPPSESPLKARVLRAGSWTIAGYAASQATRLASSLIMTRLLVPEMFGVMAIATMVTAVLSLLSDMGLAQKIVQSRRGDDPDFLDTAWVVQIVRGCLLWLVALLVSAGLYLANLAGVLPEQSVYANPTLPLIIAVASLSVAISGCRSTKMITAHRKFDQRQRIQVELVGQLAALLAMAALGILTRSIWALVAGGLVASLLSAVLSHTWMAGHANRLRWDPAAFRELVSFGKWIALSSVVFVLAANGDRLLLGGLVGEETLGFYAIAALILGAIEGSLATLLTTVSLPALSEVARTNPSRLREVYYRLRLPSDVLMLLAAGFLYSAGGPVIELLYDPRYLPAGSMMQVLALSLFTARYGVAHQVYLAVGMPRYLAAINVVRLVSLYVLVPTLYYLAGIQAAIYGIALHGLVTVPFVYAFNARLSINDFRRELIVLGCLPTGWLGGAAFRALMLS